MTESFSAPTPNPQPTRTLPYPADLKQLKQQAKELLRDYRARKPTAVEEVRRFEREPSSDQFRLHDAQRVLARSYGFASWPKLKHYFDAVEHFSRVPNHDPPPSATPSRGTRRDEFLRLACLTVGHQDHPARWERARQMLADEPELAGADIYTAAAAGDEPAVRGFLDRQPSLACQPGGPHHWEPILYVAYSRLQSRADGPSSVQIVRHLLSRGADPNAGFLWAGFPCPYTVLTGVFGEGECGHIRQPPHAFCNELAALLIEQGADPNDFQTLYNRMFRRDDAHLGFLFRHGLGTGGRGVWYERLAEQEGGWVTSPADMLAYQLQWASRWNYRDRVELLLENGVDPNRPSRRPGARAPYEEAVYHGNRDIAELLLHYGAQSTPLDSLDTFAAACLAADARHAREMLATDSSLIKRLGERAETVVATAIESNQHEAVRLMHDLGFDIDTDAMNEAARYGYVELIKLLVQLGVSSHTRAAALDFAGYYQQFTVVDYLVQFAGIHQAVRRDRPARVEELLRQNPELAQSRDEDGDTPLHHLRAEMTNGPTMIELLVSWGADVNARNGEGLTPLGKLVTTMGLLRRDDLCQRLRKHGAE